MKQLILILLSFLIFSCKKEKSIEKNIIGTWQADSINIKETSKNETNNIKTKVSGLATYPSDGIPDYINVYAQDINSKKIYNHKTFDRKQGYFEMELPQGEYYIFSAENSDNFDKPNKKEVVKVVNGKNIENINAQDLYVSDFVPVMDNEINETNNITLRLLEDLTDLKNINPSKVQTQLQSFNKNWSFRNDYSENGEYFFGKQNEVIQLRLKGIKNTLFYSFLNKKTFEEIKEQINTYVDLKILKTENDLDYNKKYYETPYHKIMLAEVKENGKIFGYNVMMSTK